MAAEIERKFLLEREPGWLEEHPFIDVEQGYLALEDALEVRVRRVRGETPQLTVKRGRGGTREEVEIELSAEQAEALWPLTEGRRLSKRRYLAERDGACWEIDVFAGELEGLLIAEVESPTERESRALRPPAWVGREVTEEPGYANRELALAGRPAG